MLPPMCVPSDIVYPDDNQITLEIGYQSALMDDTLIAWFIYKAIKSMLQTCSGVVYQVLYYT